MGYPLHGQDISPAITPVEAGLGWAIGWDKASFPGRDALIRQRETGPTRRLRAIRAQERAIPRPHMVIYDASDQRIGDVTSGTFSPSLKEGIALALLDAQVGIDDDVYVDVRGKRVPFSVVKAPFVPSHVR
jgi:aminomethyltransferase